MHIMLVTSYFPPEFGAASDLYYDLAETLADMGHRVTVITRFPRYRLETSQRGIYRKEQFGRSIVVRIATSPFAEAGPMLRGLDHLTQAPMCFLAGVLAGKADVILFHSPPLTLGLACWALARLWHVPYVANIQDLFPKYAIDIGVMKNRRMIRAFQALERFVYRTADAVTVNARGNEDYILARGGSQESTLTVSNYIDVDVIQPGPRYNAFRDRTRLGESFAVQYAGTMGFQQDLDTVLGAANLLREEPDVAIVLIGDGVERPRLEAEAARLQLQNVRFLPYQPREDFPLVLQAADAGIVTLRADVTSSTIPSKLMGIMAAGKPVLIAADPNGDAPKTVRDARAGICVAPGDPEELAAAIRRLRNDPELATEMGRRGRAYAEAHFSRQAAAAAYESLFTRLLAVRTPGRRI